MANFFFIDHSLKDRGGHHADYARCVINSAERMGFRATLGANTRFARDESLGENCDIIRCFRNTIYQRDSYLAGLQHLKRTKRDFLNLEPPGSWREQIATPLSRWRHRKSREKLIREFAVDCDRFFSNTIFTASDHAFLAGVSELEVLGLARFLANQPRTLQVNWHLQFHFNLFEGRPPEYGKQLKTARVVQSCLQAAFSRLQYHSIHLYTTTETLADQYNRLGVLPFEPLPYPISPKLNPRRTTIKINDEQRLRDRQSTSDTSRRTSPLRIGLPGQLRREKGCANYFQDLVTETWPLLESGNIQYVAQCLNDRWPRKNKLSVSFPQEPATATSDLVEYKRYPLNEEQYVSFLKSLDCGLLFYDSRVYFSRRAGVMGELLSAGKPCIVPAGSWLADQIQRPAFDHVQSTLDQHPNIRQLELADFEWNHSNVPFPGGVISFDQQRNPFEFGWDSRPGETAFVLNFDQHWPTTVGVYTRIHVRQLDSAGEIIQSETQVTGRLRQQPRCHVLFNIEPPTTRIEIKLSNAFHDSQASVKKLKVTTIRANNELPQGAVGIIAADQADLARCIRQFVDHVDHYQETAAGFAESWFLKHQPDRTLAHLLATDQQFLRTA